MTLTISQEGANAEVNALTVLLNSGFLRIYAGTRPINPDTAISSATLLAEFQFAAIAFMPASAGIALANTIFNVPAGNTGTANFYRAIKSDGVTPVVDGAVGVAGQDLNLNATTIHTGDTVSITSFSYTQPS